MNAQQKPRGRARFGTPLWRVILSVLGVLLILYGLYPTLLGALGTEVTAEVTHVSPIGKYQSKTLTGGHGTVQVDYTFKTASGQKVSGTSAYGTSINYDSQEARDKLTELSVHYLPILPQINKATVLTGFRLENLGFPAIGLLLILLINLRAVRKKKQQALRDAHMQQYR